jgi:hypothetical protein
MRTNKAMTLQDAKDAIAKETVFKTWYNIFDELHGTEDYCEYLEQAAELYASQYKSEVERLKREYSFGVLTIRCNKYYDDEQRLKSEISLLQEQLRLSEENNKVLLEKLKGGEETENNGEMEDYINITFSLNIDTFNRFLKALKCGDPELWAEIKDDIKEHLEDACKRAKLKPHQSN